MSDVNAFSSTDNIDVLAKSVSATDSKGLYNHATDIQLTIRPTPPVPEVIQAAASTPVDLTRLDNENSASVHVIVDEDDDQSSMELQELTASLVHHSELQLGNHDVRNSLRRGLLWIRALARFKAASDRAAIPSTSLASNPHVQDLESGQTPEQPAVPEILDDECCGEMQVRQRDTINRIVQEKKLEELYDFGGVAGVAEALNSHLEDGIVVDTVDIRQRNVPIIKCPPTCPPLVLMFFHCLREALRGWTIPLLAVTALLSFAFEIVEEGLEKCWFYSLILVVTIFVLVMFKLAQKYWAAIRLLRKMVARNRKIQRETTEVNVIRGGIEYPVSGSNLVCGDIICLRGNGMLVPANGIFVCECGEALFVQEYDSDVDFPVNEQNPFLFFGSKVIKGDAKMLVTSLGEEADWTERMRRATEASHTGFGFDKLRSQIHVVGLIICILTIVVLFVRAYILHQKDDEQGYRPEIKGEPVEFRRIVNSIRKIVRDSKLTTLFFVSLVGMEEGLPFVVSIAIFYWKAQITNMEDSTIDTSVLLKTKPNSSVTIICSTTIAWLTQENHQEVVRDAVKTLAEREVNTIFVSEDDVDALKNTVHEIGLDYPDSDDDAVVRGEDFHQFNDEDRMEKLDKICIMGNSSIPHKLLLVKFLKRRRKVVLVLGENTADALVIQKADVGQYIDTGSFRYLISIIKFERFIIGNMSKLIQIELILTLASWSINLITVMVMGDAPLTTLQLVWLNLLVSFPGGLALLSGHSLRKVLEDEVIGPCNQLITKAMWRNIIVQVSYQIGIFVALQCKGKDIHGIGTQEVSKSIIYNGFALCQIFNIFCARELEKKNIFNGLGHNYLFWAVSVLLLVLQVAFVEVAPIFNSSTPRLNWKQWAVSFFIGAATWFFDSAGKFASEHIGFAKSTASASMNNTLQDRLVDG